MTSYQGSEIRMWILGMQLSRFSKNFPGIRDVPLARKSLIDAMREGDFTPRQKRLWLPTLKDCYEHFCRKHGEMIYPFPDVLRKHLPKERLHAD